MAKNTKPQTDQIPLPSRGGSYVIGKDGKPRLVEETKPEPTRAEKRAQAATQKAEQEKPDNSSEKTNGDDA